jgi:hydroxymethylpyrimidine/phosphomethylpyrimidine kinase
VTALTAQNTLGVLGVMPVEPGFVRQQMDAVLDDIGADVVKTGMLHDAGIIRAVAAVLRDKAASLPLVLDPVMVATSGAPLLDAAALDVLKHELIPRAAVLTPNLPEAERLLGRAIEGGADMPRAAHALQAMGAAVVVLKGGHGAGAIVHDVVAEGAATYVLEAPRIETRHTHGTGCTLASAIATGIAQGLAPRAAIERAHAYVQQAIRTAPGFGAGHGPLNHAHGFTTNR